MGDATGSARDSGDGLGCFLIGLPVLILLAPLIGLIALLRDLRIAFRRREIRRRWGSQKRGLLVYSDSPNWQAYIEANWLPRFSEQLVVLNWSERSRWQEQGRSFDAALFRRYAGQSEFNPVAIIFLPRRRFELLANWFTAIRRRDAFHMLLPDPGDVLVIRFYRAFRDFKHGKDRALRAHEQTLTVALANYGGSVSA